MSEMLRHALSGHDIASPCTPAELLTLAGEMEDALIVGECQFSHPDWRYVDGLRALAASLSPQTPPHTEGECAAPLLPPDGTA